MLKTVDIFELDPIMWKLTWRKWINFCGKIPNIEDLASLVGNGVGNLSAKYLVYLKEPR